METGAGSLYGQLRQYRWMHVRECTVHSGSKYCKESKSMGQNRKKKVAVVQCAGGCLAGKELLRTEMPGDCSRLAESSSEEMCKWGCLGQGSCTAVCRTDAIRLNENGAAEVDPEKCDGCGLCVKICPRGLIRITSAESSIYPACVNEDPGAQTRKTCTSGCIACGICVKNCPVDAISIERGHALIDEEKCIACGMCAVQCPRGAILDFDGIFTVRKGRVEV